MLRTTYLHGKIALHVFFFMNVCVNIKVVYNFFYKKYFIKLPLELKKAKHVYIDIIWKRNLIYSGKYLNLLYTK